MDREAAAAAGGVDAPSGVQKAPVAAGACECDLDSTHILLSLGFSIPPQLNRKVIFNTNILRDYDV